MKRMEMAYPEDYGAGEKVVLWVSSRRIVFEFGSCGGAEFEQREGCHLALKDQRGRDEESANGD